MDKILNIDIQSLIQTAGYFGILGIVFAESGLFVGFFLPGDSLLFTAGFLASQGFLNIFILILVCFTGAILGDNFGYYFGKRVGPAIFKKEKSIFFRKDYLDKSKAFYIEHGAKTIFLARFFPIVRTFAPILAGVGEMNYQTFFFYNFWGALVWGGGIPLLGYYLGSVFPGADRYIIEIVIGIIVVSSLPGIIQILRK